jgi:hypothetical protein
MAAALGGAAKSQGRSRTRGSGGWRPGPGSRDVADGAGWAAEAASRAGAATLPDQRMTEYLGHEKHGPP